MEHKERELVDVDAIFKSNTDKKIPKFVINYFKKIVHQDEINECIIHGNYNHNIGFFKAALEFLNIKFEVRGLEHLPKEGRYLFAGNHPLGGPEALILGDIFQQEFGESFRVPVNSLLTHLPPLREFFVPINIMSGKQDRNLSHRMNAMFESDYQVLVFPAGKCARKVKGEIVEQPWKKMFVTRAKQSQRDIVPMHFSGCNSNFFYFLCNLSDRLHLKFNIGMLYLADELFKQRNKTFTITFGEPIKWESLDKSKTDATWANEIRSKCLALEG